MTKARNLSNLLDATGDVISSALDNVPPSNNASSLTTGTLDVARLSDGSITNAKLNNDAKVVKSASAPSSPSEGDLWYDTGNEELKIYTTTDNAFVKVVRVTPTLDSIAEGIYNGQSGNLTLTGTGFLTSTLIVSFTPSGGSATTVTVTASSDTTATVAIPSAIYNLSGGTVINISVQNTDLRNSGNISKTIIELPSGGTITTSGNYKIHTFTSSGTFTVPTGLTLTNVEYLVIAGGGGGGANRGGGAGAGGYRSSVVGENSGGGATAESRQTITAGSYTVTIGAGGSASGTLSTDDGGQGSDSSFNGITSLGGGLGRSDDEVGASGGSGAGGGGGGSFAGGSGTTGQGYAGGTSQSNANTGNGGAGGGGAGGTGVGSSTALPAGGAGVTSSITGSAVTRASGGGGGMGGFNSNTSATAGGGGKGADSSTSANGNYAQANTGGGGGGGAEQGNCPAGGQGGSGIVIIRYTL